MRNCFSVLFTIILMLPFQTGWSNNYPKDYFQLPVKRDIRLSGTFGELRSNHFHAGIDIKSLDGTEGEKVYASAQGYISRIKVEAFGYGNAIYIAHPNGYTTVYAHLQKFPEEIAKYVRSKQYQHEKFNVDLYPKADRFVLKKGEYIGNLGNSGSSFGPHLHFEIRRTADQVPVNPLLFGLKLKDNTRPSLHQIVVYYLNDKMETIDKKAYDLTNTGTGTYKVGGPIKAGAWRVAFGLKTYDQMDATRNQNGVYTVNLSVDEDEIFGFTMDAIPFSKTRFLNAHLDYEIKKRTKGNVNRLYTLPGNTLKIYEGNGGIIELYKDKARKVSIEVEDVHQNISTLSFDILRSEKMAEPSQEKYNYAIPYDKEFHLQQTGLEAVFLAGTFYHNTYLAVSKEELQKDQQSPGYRIGNRTIPCHRYFDLSLPYFQIDPVYRQKAFIAYVNEEEGKVYNAGGKYENDAITTSTRTLGLYTIKVDTEAPRIKPIRFSENMNGNSYMSFVIEDNFEAMGAAKDLRFEGRIDGKWILMEFDGKRDLITHRFRDDLGQGEHHLVLKVTDDRGNVATFDRKFVR